MDLRMCSHGVPYESGTCEHCQEITTLRAKLTQVEQDRDRLAAEVEKLYVGHAELFHDLKAENERLVEECKTLNEIYHRQLGDQMELYEIRREMHRIGERLIGEEIDEQDQIAVGGELIGLSRLCHFCGGTGEDGDPDGGTYACDSCGGKALVGQSPSERITDLQTQLTAAQEENKRLTEENADLLAALQIVKEQRQLWWGKAVHRGRELAAAQQSAQEQFRKGMERAAEIAHRCGCQTFHCNYIVPDAIRAELSKGKGNEH